MKILTFFNNKGGVGKTTLTFHIGYKLAQLGFKVLFVDLDPQCNLTSYALEEKEIEQLWNNKKSIYYVVEPLIIASGDININIKPIQVKSNKNLFIIPGDINLSIFEDTLSTAWTEVLARRERGFRITFGIYRYLKYYEKELNLDYVLVDLGPNFGPLNRMAILSCTNYIIPLVPDLFSLRGLMNIGKVIGKWSEDVYYSLQHHNSVSSLVPDSFPKFSGYIISQFNIYRRRPTKFFTSWLQNIPDYIKNYVIDSLKEIENKLNLNGKLTIDDPQHIGDFRDLQSLIPKSQSLSKPVFMLTTKDKVFGAHQQTVKEVDKKIEEICKKILQIP